MRRIAIVAIGMVVAAGLAGIIIPAYAQQQMEQQQVVNSVSAEVMSVDMEKSTLTIKAENRTISILPETKILKGGAVVKLSELTVGDKVTVKYTADASGNWTVESVSVEAVEALPATK